MIKMLFMIVFFVALSCPSFAATENTSPTGTAVCGKSVKDALSYARTKLSSDEAGADRVALLCLIDAVAQIDQRNLIVTNQEGAETLQMPLCSKVGSEKEKWNCSR